MTLETPETIKTIWTLEPEFPITPYEAAQNTVLLLNGIPIGVLFEHHEINKLLVNSLNQLQKLSDIILKSSSL